jgi:L-lactate dehydrogenase complex protein LldG
VTARDEILARIRRAHGRPGAQPTPDELARARAVIERRERGPLPAIGRAADSLAQFKSECDRVGTTHTEAASRGEVPAHVRRYLDANALPPRVVAWHELADLDWAAAGIALDDRDANAADRTSVTGSFCAIAETGTVLLLSSAAAPKATALLPETHLCVVSRARLVANMEDAFALVRRERGELPRATWFVSGPSRTADIEQTLVVGAHGPYRVHVILTP